MHTFTLSRRPALVIFDCDGVLIDSEILAARVHEAASFALGHQISSENVLHRIAEMYVLKQGWQCALGKDAAAVRSIAEARTE